MNERNCYFRLFCTDLKRSFNDTFMSALCKNCEKKLKFNLKRSKIITNIRINLNK